MIKRLVVYSAFIFLSAVGMWGQCVGNCTTVTGTLTDSSSQLWVNATVTANFIPPFGNPSKPLNNGVPLASLVYTTVTNGSGNFTLILDSTNLVTPAGSKWSFTMCPNATVINCSQLITTVTGVTLNLTTQLSSSLIIPSVNAGPVLQRAYSDAEANGGTGSTYWNTTTNVLKGCSVGPCPANSWSVLGNLGSNLLFFGNYTVFISAGIVKALNNNTNNIDYSSADASIVFNNILTANASVGAHLFIKPGVYQFLSATLEPFSIGFTLYCAICIPSNPVGNWVDWYFEGETRTAIAWNFDSNANTPSLNSGGVVLYMTPTLVASVLAANSIAGIWQHPDPTYLFTNEDYFDKITVRFPTNQRAHESGIALLYADSLSIEHSLVDFNQNYLDMENGSLPATDTEGIRTSFGSAGNIQLLRDVGSVGYQYAYDIEGEHLVAESIHSAICTNAGIIGMFPGLNNSPVFHNNTFTKIVDQECQNGWIFGIQVANGQMTDFRGYDLEFATTGTFARVNNLCEVNVGFTTGDLTFTSVQKNVGLVAINPFSSFSGPGCAGSGKNIAWHRGTTTSYACGATTTCSQSLISGNIITTGGSLSFASATTITITNLPFSAITSYSCWASDNTTLAGVINPTYLSASSVRFTETGGSNTDAFRWNCQGN